MRLFRRGESASTLDLLVAGLGNPGREYVRTRHNVGHMVRDELARRQAGSFRSKFSGELSEVRLDGERVALLKPLTYMNESGRSVGAALRFFKLPPEQLLVVHDEVDLDLGRLQARLGGGLAGHNGLRSVAQHFGTPGVRAAQDRRRPARARRSAPGRRLGALAVHRRGRRRGARRPGRRCGRGSRARRPRRGAAALQRAPGRADRAGRFRRSPVPVPRARAAIASNQGGSRPPRGRGTKEGGPSRWRTTRRRCSRAVAARRRCSSFLRQKREPDLRLRPVGAGLGDPAGAPAPARLVLRREPAGHVLLRQADAHEETAGRCPTVLDPERP